MKVRTKLTIGFSLVVVLIWITVFFGMNAYRNIHREVTALQLDFVPGVIALTEMEGATSDTCCEVMEYIFHDDADTKQTVLSKVQQQEDMGLAYVEHETHIGQEEQKMAHELMGNIRAYNSAIAATVNLKEQGASNDELVDRVSEILHPTMFVLQRQLSEHKATHMQKLAIAEEIIHEEHLLGTRTLILSAGLITLLAVGAAIITTRSIVKPLHALHRGIEMIEQGNLDYKVGTRAKDEIGQLSRAFDHMTRSLTTSMTSIDKLNKEINERKRAEEQLRESEHKYRILVENIPQKIFLKDKNSVYKSCNENYARDLKLKPEEIAGKTDYDFYTKELAEKYRADDRRIIESGKTENIEEKYLQAGQERLVQTFKVPVRDEEGNVTGVLGIFHDITERKRAEEALKESEEFSTSLLENAPNPISVVNPDTSIKYTNPAFEKLTGFTSAQVVGRKAPYPWWPEELIEEFSVAFKEAMAGSTKIRERILRKKNGEHFWVVLSSVPVRHNGALKYFLVNWVDITKRKQMEATLQGKNEQLDAQNEELSTAGTYRQDRRTGEN